MNSRATTNRTTKPKGRKATKADCTGCYNNVYNHGCGGAKQCWSLESAVMVKKLDIHVDQPPPYKGIKPTLRPDCYKEQRWARVDPETIGKDGYWKR